MKMPLRSLSVSFFFFLSLCVGLGDTEPPIVSFCLENSKAEREQEPVTVTVTLLDNLTLDMPVRGINKCEQGCN